MAFTTHSFTRSGGFLMEPRKEEKQEPKAPEGRREEPKLQIVKLEERIAPRTGIDLNHNETLVREPAQAKPKAAEVRKGDTKDRFHVVKLEERIAPKLAANHNE